MPCRVICAPYSENPKVSSSSFYGKKQRKRESERIILMPTTICVLLCICVFVFFGIVQCTSVSFRITRARIACTKAEPKSSGDSPAASMFQNHFQDECKASNVTRDVGETGVSGTIFSHQKFRMEIE